MTEYLSNQEELKVNVFVKKHGGIFHPVINNNLPYTINLIGGRDWSKFKKWYIRLSLRKYLKLNENPVIISSNWELSEGLIPYRNKYKFCLVTVLHGLEVTRLQSKRYAKKAKRFVQSISNSDHVISVSNYTKNKAELISGYKKIKTIPNFVNTKKSFIVDKKKSRRKLGFEESDKILLTLSRLVKRKGHETVINAISLIINKIPDIKYVIAGSGEEKYAGDLKQLVSKLKLDRHVLFLGYIEEDNKNDLYNACDIYIMNSNKTDEKGDSEGFGITFLESNACGKPVIGSNAGGIPDAITNRENGLLIEPNNPTKTAQAIYELFNDEKLYNQLSENGITRIKENFSINKVGEKYMEIILNHYDY